ncbi:MAG: glycosyltransferase family 2 protein [Paludibacteraceae bacterium]|nr:glycosyltransferase family 2 protein [Paludibacteraceae bacterium]
MPKVSIIIPLYNKAQYVVHCLQSIASQSFVDWECIIINDGSTDASAEVVSEWLAKEEDCSRFRLISQPNSGVAVARNNGVKAACGELVTFLDADDWWESAYLEQMVAFAEKTPDAGLWAANYIYYKPGKTRVGVTNPAYIEGAYIDYPLSYYRGTGMPVWTGATMMRRSVYEASGGFSEGIRLGEDFLLWSKIALRHPVAFLDKPLAYYNNDIPSGQRATHNLHAPEHNMLWHLEEIECMIAQSDLSAVNHPQAVAWKQLLDKLRVEGLRDYWLDKGYHEAAAEQLRKVDWSAQPDSVVRFYRAPMWRMRCKHLIYQTGSVLKQTLVKILHLS